MANGRDQSFTTEQIIEAVKGSGGIKATIARRLNCHRHTVNNYIARYATVAQAFEDECETTDDIAESVVILNIKLAFQQQQANQLPVDSSDAKWWIERRRRDRFSLKQEFEHSGGANPIILKVEYGDRANGTPTPAASKTD